MNDWVIYNLAEAPLKIIDGDRGKNYPSQNDFIHDSGYCVFLSTKNVRLRGFEFSELSFISKEKDESLRKGKLQRNDIVLTTRGTVGHLAIYDCKTHFDHIRINSGMVIIRPELDKLQPKWLLYALLDSVEQFIQHTSGSAQPQLPIRDLNKVLLTIPPLIEQESIAEVLTSLDDKIDLLHLQNKTLEALAETLFRQWFVEEADDSWEEKTLKELVSVVIDNRGKTPPTVEYKTAYPLIEVNALSSSDCLINYDVIRKYVTEETYKTWFRKHLTENDIIFSTVGTIGVFSILLENIGVIAQNLIGLRFKYTSPYYIYCFLKENIDVITSLDIGGVQPSIKVPHLLDMTIKYPPQILVQNFHNEVDCYFKKINSNSQQINTLTKLRDTLLPKLMSGAVRVNDNHV